MINIFQPCLGAEELAAIDKVFKSNWIGKGNEVLAFERAFAASLRSDPALFTTTTACTEGLFLAARLFDFGPGDEIIVPTCSFVAVGSVVVGCGAKLVFCDVDPRTMNVSAEHVAARISRATKAIFVTHYGGVPTDMDPVLELCRSRGIRVIEDAATCVRSFYKGRACGTLGDMGTWSFDAMKTLCTGDGGMIFLRTPELVEAAKEDLYLGLPNKQKSGMDSSATGAASWWEFEVTRPGRRAIMNNIAGAIGLTQMQKLDGFLARRRSIYERYAGELSGIDWLTLPPPIPRGCESSYYFFWIQLEQRDALAAYLLKKGVYTTFRYWPLHRVEYFASKGTPTDAAQFPGAEYVSRHTLNIPLHQSLSDGDVDNIVGLIRGFKA